MDGNTGRHARSAPFSYSPENENTASVSNEQMNQTSRRRRMERYERSEAAQGATELRQETGRSGASQGNRTAPQQTAGQQPSAFSGSQNAYSHRMPGNAPETTAQRPVMPDSQSYPGRSAVTGQMPQYNGSQNGYTMPQSTGRSEAAPGNRIQGAGWSSEAAQGDRIQGEGWRSGAAQGDWTAPQAPYNGQRQPRMASNGRPISEWQKKVPNPPMTIRRDLTEDGEDPLIASTRSPEVYNRTGKFWGESDQTGSYTPVNPVMNTGRNTTRNTRTNGEIFPDVPPEEEPRVEKTERMKPLVTAGIFIAGLIVLWIILRFTLFRVSKIIVTGTENYTDEYVIQLSGIHTGDNMMTLNEDQIKTGIANEVHLQFAYLEKKVPGEIVIAVKERQPAAYLNYCGITYVTDKSGMVLEENEDPEYRPQGLIEVKGMKIRTSFTTGQNLPLVTEEQSEVFKSLFLELRVIGCNSLIREVDISKTDEVYLLTQDDISVAMGSNINFHAKLRSMMVVREEIIGRGYTGGTIDVTDPEHPIYVPPVL